MRFLLLLVLALTCRLSVAQTDSTTIPNSENGWILSPHGMIRVLVLFAEIDYDVHPEKDPQRDGADHWPKGQLPKWKDDVFDAKPSAVPHAMVSRYYHDVSLGNFEVLGDYVDRLLVLKESEYKNPGNYSGNAVTEANKLGALHTAHNLGIEDFDLWKRGGKAGLPKINAPDDPHSYDHVMVILRNSALTHGQGSTDPGSPGKLYGFESDSESRFGGMNALPFEILKHEFNHLLLGGNNFHSGGGNAAQFESYTLCLQGGWSLMGAASSSLLTCSAWDRDRLDWRARDAQFRINARNPQGSAINGDLDPLEGDTGIFILRDFVTSGDALRIRIPFIPEGEYPQWLWIENHQTYARNGSPTDRFHWESAGNACVAAARPGLYMTMQIDRDNKRGTEIYSGNADYLRPLTACGHFDLALTADTIRDKCPFGGEAIAYERTGMNPLAGNSEMELIVYDRNSDNKLERGEHFVPNVLRERNSLSNNARFFGRPEHAFTRDGNARVGMGTNPSSANMLSLTCTGKREQYDRRPGNGPFPDNRTVYLNGISIGIIDQQANGDIAIRIRANDTRIDNDLRWCADSIVLPTLRGAEGASLYLTRGHRLLIDRSRTPTRMVLLDEMDHYRYFAPPTRFTLSTGAVMKLGPKCSLRLEHGSVVHVMPGAQLLLDPSAKLDIDASSRIVVHGDGKLSVKEKTLKKLRKKGRIANADQ